MKEKQETENTFPGITTIQTHYNLILTSRLRLDYKAVIHIIHSLSTGVSSLSRKQEINEAKNYHFFVK